MRSNERAHLKIGRWAFTAIEAMPLYVESSSHLIVTVGADTASYARTMGVLNSRDVIVVPRT